MDNFSARNHQQIQLVHRQVQLRLAQSLSPQRTYLPYLTFVQSQQKNKKTRKKERLGLRRTCSSQWQKYDLRANCDHRNSNCNDSQRHTKQYSIHIYIYMSTSSLNSSSAHLADSFITIESISSCSSSPTRPDLPAKPPRASITSTCVRATCTCRPALAAASSTAW